ncbi:pyridoxamine 5'-phosphate oxidase family protein [Ornithinimicrobium sediminis]|jgi:uncharacterized protein|uniref:pyridoxamine 5'-phosphate oxidase family protein n=1 Tax=Ornithinimicrobium sediminis TaxID=2904603 RepID=UPI001E2A9C83|nr:pyridoxamine 5'-phosphate oxidase family protein [Ornithinimicrobium sediminis]MCE0486999.1 pyridoxamine 5'-phosphate oxidase family protein [Ornithinimicrobium sediminis]
MDIADHSQMSSSACWARLRESPVGRLAVVVDGLPEIFPVNHVVDHGSILFRTTDGSKLRASAGGRHVAYEVDGQDLATGEAWSVVAKGMAHEVKDITRVLEALSLPIQPWQSGSKPHIVRIDPDEVTGRSFVISQPSR